MPLGTLTRAHRCAYARCALRAHIGAAFSYRFFNASWRIKRCAAFSRRDGGGVTSTSWRRPLVWRGMVVANIVIGDGIGSAACRGMKKNVVIVGNGIIASSWW